MSATRATRRGVQAVLLDAAGTLITTARPVGESYAACAQRFGAALEPAALMAGFRTQFPAMPPMAFPLSPHDSLLEQERDWWRTLVRRVVAQAGGGIDDFEGFFDALFHYFAQAQAWRLYPEVAEVLRTLRGEGYALAVVSNFDSRLLGILEGLGLAPFLDAVVYSTAAGAAKPDERIFASALVRLHVTAAQALHVGDGLAADFHGARAAGLQALLLRRPGAEEAAAAAHCIRSLAQLPNWLAARR